MGEYEKGELFVEVKVKRYTNMLLKILRLSTGDVLKRVSSQLRASFRAVRLSEEY